MSSFNRGHAADALRLLAERSILREEDVRQYNKDPDLDESDTEADSPCPIFDRFYEEGGAEGIKQMSHFDPMQIEKMWLEIFEHVSATYNVGRGRRSDVSGKDAFFMTLVVLKHGGLWDELARGFNMKGPTFERLITRYVVLISDYMYNLHVRHCAAYYTMKRLKRNNLQFENFPNARYATDVTFQQANRPGVLCKKARSTFQASTSSMDTRPKYLCFPMASP